MDVSSKGVRQMIAVGYIALIFAFIGGIILLVFHDYPNEKPVKTVNYRSIYSELAPKEL